MSKYKYELHAHTDEVSPCGHVNACEIVKMYEKAGYHGIVFTDHFHLEYLDQLGSISWNEKVDLYLEGYRLGAEEGRRIGLDVLWGIELRFTENNNDFLVYGVDEDFLYQHSSINEYNIAEFMNLVNERDDILVYQAHPFRPGCYLVDPVTVHGLEIYNGNLRHPSRNEMAEKTAVEKGLMFISGSDFHKDEDLASGGVMFSKRISTNKELVDMLKIINYESLIIP